MVRILITGVSTRAIAESAKAAGYDFVTLDYFGDYDQKTWCENYALARDFGLPYGPGPLYEASRRLKYDAIVYTASLENHPATVARLAAGAALRGTAGGNGSGLLGNRPEALKRVRHGPTLFAFLGDRGVPTPQTLFGNRPASATPHRWLRKPVSSGGGHDVTFWDAGRPPGRGYLLQQHLAGQVCSAAFVANGREAVVLGLTEQLIGRPEFGATGFIYCGNLYPLLRTDGGALEELAAEVGDLATALTREFGLVGLNGLDFVLCDGRVWPLEVNPRYSASMELIEAAWGLSMFDCHVRAVLHGDLPDPGRADVAGGRASDPNGSTYGKAILYAERDCRAPDTRNWAERGIRDVPFPGEAIVKGSPICTVLSSAATADACYAGLVEGAEALGGELYA